MMKSDLRVPARYYARIIELAPTAGIDLRAVLNSLNIPRGLLSDPEATISVSLVDQLLCEVARRTERTDLAFDVGRMLTASSHNFVGFGMLSSASVDQALRFEAQYFRLVMPSFRMRYVSGQQHFEMAFAPQVAMSRVCLAFHLEAIAMAALRELTDLVGDRRPECRLELSIAEPAHGERYRKELRNVETNFSVNMPAGVSLRFFADPRSLALEMADSTALKVAEARCRTLVQKVASGGRFADWVAMTLSEVAEGLPSLEELANHLNISKRTLNRYLEREGTSYRALAGRIQHDLACERLSNGMSASEVGYSLGFSDPSNFSKAFRARAGYSPGEHQRRSGESVRNSLA